MGIRKKHVRDRANELLRRCSIKSAPVEVLEVAKALQIEVKLEKVDDDLSGFLYKDPKSGKAVIGANSAHHENRRNFTIAHELGHFLLHETESVHLDSRKPGYMLLQRRDKKSAMGEDILEREANLFAAELLMPAAFLERDLKGKSLDLLADDSFLEKLAKRYGVSLQALTIRLSNLGYIHD